MQDKNNPKQAAAQQKNKKEQEKDDPNQKKKIDFKEKALKAKENSIKKVVAKGMKSSGGKGPSTGAG